MLATFLFWLFIISVAVQCSYAFYFFTRIYNIPGKKSIPDVIKQPVSVIICARNEARNLEQYLPYILSQRYTNEHGKPMYEVIVVNDASEDDTETVLLELEQRYGHLWHITITKEAQRSYQGKKFALSRGLEHASHDWLLLTDADCKPAGDEWLHRMVLPLSQDREIVCGYGGIFRKPGFLNAFIRWETVHTMLQYTTYAMAGMPYMGVGRNLACTKAVLQRAQASAVWNQLPSGDDDLLVQACGTKDNVAIVAHKDAFTWSLAKQSWGEWVKQKQRHLSTGKYYNGRTRLLLGTYAISHALSWALMLLLLFFGDRNMVVLLFALRCVLYWTLWQFTALKLQERKFFYWIPLCDIGWAVYNTLFSPYIFWKNKKQWK